jgi:hypothetical protein
MQRHRKFPLHVVIEYTLSYFTSVRSEGGVECRQSADAVAIAARLSPNNDEDFEDQSNASERKTSPPQ